MTAPDENLVQQLRRTVGQAIEEADDDYALDVPGHIARAVLASGLVVPAEPVRQVAARYDGRRTNGSAVANRLRAILHDPQHHRETP